MAGVRGRPGSFFCSPSMMRCLMPLFLIFFGLVFMWKYSSMKSTASITESESVLTIESQSCTQKLFEKESYLKTLKRSHSHLDQAHSELKKQLTEVNAELAETKKNLDHCNSQSDGKSEYNNGHYTSGNANNNSSGVNHCEAELKNKMEEIHRWVKGYLDSKTLLQFQMKFLGELQESDDSSDRHSAHDSPENGKESSSNLQKDLAAKTLPLKKKDTNNKEGNDKPPVVKSPHGENKGESVDSKDSSNKIQVNAQRNDDKNDDSRQKVRDDMQKSTKPPANANLVGNKQFIGGRDANKNETDNKTESDSKKLTNNLKYTKQNRPDTKASASAPFNDKQIVNQSAKLYTESSYTLPQQLKKKSTPSVNESLNSNKEKGSPEVKKSSDTTPQSLHKSLSDSKQNVTDLKYMKAQNRHVVDRKMNTDKPSFDNIVKNDNKASTTTTQRIPLRHMNRDTLVQQIANNEATRLTKPPNMVPRASINDNDNDGRPMKVDRNQMDDQKKPSLESPYSRKKVHSGDDDDTRNDNNDDQMMGSLKKFQKSQNIDSRKKDTLNDNESKDDLVLQPNRKEFINADPNPNSKMTNNKSDDKLINNDNSDPHGNFE